MVLVYFIVVFIATIIGALGGVGGGIFIKPILDIIGYHDVSTIGVYSCIAVFVMCVVSIIKKVKSNQKVDIKTGVYISIGSIVGGYVGDVLFNYLLRGISNHAMSRLQSILLIIILIIIIVYTLNQENIKKYYLRNCISIFSLGMFLGTISVFLGIGGGPLNIVCLVLFMNYDIKSATFYSIITIFFSQITKIVSLIVTNTLFNYDLSFVLPICVAAIIGGYIGTYLNYKMSDKKMKKAYVSILYILLFTSTLNFLGSYL